MAIKGAKTIAEYRIRKRIEKEDLAEEYFKFKMTGAREAVLCDSNDDEMRMVHDPGAKIAQIV